ncbi:FAD-dependent tricarballylate dehydrogenase TcuA [Bacillus sp. FJAT-50079]|uniref:FAD-dependent tricarballylate dehydrogenase TcuA n=1 Tax=Bacillus sp. FJAT-50079 TaxID=2833577 RepID=UPI001BC97408|nr:FAD-dependent tricarballylate dehydrogenase TcuA [Bacillus sp. FJAT-50079]MBS4208177.1 FAD-dependent tricarballylate dehydrogenase TcuA [Bacillus sp. FJAT-50079]
MTTPITDHYDVIVVGAGNAALCAAISATEQGANVLVLEKAPRHKRGGNSFFTDGAIRFAYKGIDEMRKVIPTITDEEAKKIDLPEYNESDYYDDLMRVTNGKSDSKLANLLVSKSYETIAWMQNHGIEFELNYENQAFEKEGKYIFWGGLPVKTNNKGVGLVKKLNERAQELGIKVWYESQAVKLNTDQNNITSVVVQRGEETVIVNTDSVILACGGFEANKRMRSKQMGAEWESAIVRGTEYNTGDGLSMALAIGAQKYGEWSGGHSIGTDYNAPKVGNFNKPGDIYKKSSFPLGLLVNKDGVRFVDEGADFRNYTYAKYGREVLKQPNNMAYQLFDAQVRPMLRKEYNLEEATVYEANSLEELAEKIDINKEEFLKTIQEYNEAVQDGTYNPTIKDQKETRGITPPKSNWALRIDQAPYYAYPVTCGITFTFGGLKIGSSGEVLDQNDAAIAGLYAAGEMVGGLFYENYPGGSGLMSGAVFGKLAGSSAAKYSLEKRGAVTI